MQGPGWLSEQLIEDAADLRRHDLAVDPFLANALPELPMDFEQRTEQWGAAMRDRHWTGEIRLKYFGPCLLPSDVAAEAAATAYRVTAVLDGAADERSIGRVRLQAERSAERRLDRFAEQVGFEPILRMFTALRAYEHGCTLAYYESISDESFAEGMLHLPGCRNCCRVDALWGVAAGYLRTDTMDDNTVRLRLSDEGLATWVQLRDILMTARILEDRQRYLQRLQWLRHGSEYAAVAPRIAPDQDRVRHAFIAFAGVAEGGRVLDVGAGHGLGVVDPGGLAEVVGPRGEVIALDPQRYMLDMLMRTARSRGLRNVQTQLGVAERINLPANHVDFVTGQTSLHFFDLEAFTAEAWRVLRPGVYSLPPSRRRARRRHSSGV